MGFHDTFDPASCLSSLLQFKTRDLTDAPKNVSSCDEARATSLGASRCFPLTYRTLAAESCSFSLEDIT